MKVIKINERKIDIKKLAAVAALARRGKVIIFPTDTVYIPLADATNKKAVEKVFLIKKRSAQKSIPIFVKDIIMAKRLAKIDKKAEAFLTSVWPGRITAVLPRKKSGLKIYGVGRESIALRVPNYKPINFLLKKLNRPLVGTSANISGQPASGSLSEVLRQLKSEAQEPDLAVDGGKLSGRPSTVVDLTVSPPKILRY